MPRLGRWYTEQEDQFGGPLVVVLSHDFWQKQFAADPAVIGRKIDLNGGSHEIIGVMPPGFAHRNAQFFAPLQRKIDTTTRGSHFLVTYARLKDGVTVERAATEMRALGATLAKEYAHNHGIDVRSYYEVVVGNVRSSLRVLLGAVVLRAVDRLRQRRQSAAGLGHRAASASSRSAWRSGHGRPTWRGS